MNLFCKRYSVCAQCKVHFEPAPQARHSELCTEHRKPVIEKEDRILRVLEWAKLNWEKLEPQALEAQKAQMQMSQQALGNLYNSQMAAQSRSGISNIAGLFGL